VTGTTPGLLVLVVEDDSATAELERRALGRAGLEVRGVSTVAEALALLAAERFDAVLVDYQLPDGDPWPVVDFAHSRVPRIPAILVTATGSERVAAEAIRHGVADYVRKTESFADLLPEAVERSTRLARLQEQNRFLASLVEAADEAIISRGLDNVITSWNRGAEELFGWTAAEALGRSLSLLLPEEIRTAQALEERVRARVRGARLETQVERKDGRLVWVLATVTPLLDAAGRVVGHCSAARDITARKRAEEALWQSQAVLAEAQAIGHVGSWDRDLATGLTRWSAGLSRIFGLEPSLEEQPREAFLDRVHPDDRAHLVEEIGRALAERRSLEVEYRVVLPDGRTRVLFSRGRITTDAQGNPVHMRGSVADITERKEMEEQLLLSSRMATVGTLAAGIAHEINNPLVAVAANVDLAREWLGELATRLTAAAPPEGDRVADVLAQVSEALADARSGAERIRIIVSDLYTFAPGDEAAATQVDLTRALEAVLSLVSGEVQKRGRLVTDLQAVPRVKASDSRLGQVFLALLLNAAQALPVGDPARHRVRVSARTAPTGHAVVEIEDSGEGMTPEVQRRIFDPFFSARRAGAGRGTGLGLTVARNLVEQLGGTLSVESRPGAGTTFRVVLPACG
jgi:PAS domain S-box-containing protein